MTFTYFPTPCSWVTWVQSSPKYSCDKRCIITALFLCKPRDSIIFSISCAFTSVAVFASGHRVKKSVITLRTCKKTCCLLSTCNDAISKSSLVKFKKEDHNNLIFNLNANVHIIKGSDITYKIRKQEAKHGCLMWESKGHLKKINWSALTQVIGDW